MLLGMSVTPIKCFYYNNLLGFLSTRSQKTKDTAFSPLAKALVRPNLRCKFLCELDKM